MSYDLYHLINKKNNFKHAEDRRNKLTYCRDLGACYNTDGELTILSLEGLVMIALLLWRFTSADILTCVGKAISAVSHDNF